MSSASILRASATELAARIRRRESSVVSVVEAHVAEAQRLNPNLNAIVVNRFSEALEEAESADARIAREGPENLPPLFGVPCTIKESFAVAGQPQTSGLVARRGVLAAQDAPTVQRLRAAGAIVIGLTNVSELCLWMEAYNRVYGRSNNPYDASRTVGGSSGGEGAAIGAGISPFGLGADIGGSIRTPAFFNGVFGHKPSSRLVPNFGQHPLPDNEGLRYLVTGPLCRRSEDLMPLVRILAGPCAEDETCVALPLQDPREVSLEGLRVINVQSNGSIRVSRDLREAQAKAAQALRDRGARVERHVIPELARSRDIWLGMLDAASETPFEQYLGNGNSLKIGREFARWLARRSPFTLPTLSLVLLERAAPLLGNQLTEAVQMGQRLQARLTELLGDDGVMLYPSYSRTAPKHHDPIRRHMFHWVYQGIINVLEFPSTQVPLGLSAEGLPLGVQVVAPHGGDHKTIAVAGILEEAFGGWVPPPPLHESH